LNLMKKGINQMPHVPATIMFPYLDNEFAWILLLKNGKM